MSVVQEIKDRIDIVDYVRQYVPALKKSGRYWKACCPFHNEKTPSFVVNPDTQSWRCFGACAEGGDVFSFAQKFNGWSFSEALHELGKQAGVEVRRQTPEQQQRTDYLDRLRGMLQTAADYYHRYLMNGQDDRVTAARQYALEKRGFTEETLTRFSIGYAPPHWRKMLEALQELGYQEDEIVEAGLASRSERGRVYDRFRNRLVIPICDERGRVVGFGARALDPDDEPKYLNSPQSEVFDKSSILFGLHLARNSIRSTGMAVIVEGYMDAIQAHQAGYANVVAQMGTAMTEDQLRLIVPRLAQRVIMALDADDAGQNATRRSLEVARQALQADYTGKLSVDIRILHIDDAKDPDDVLRETPERWPTYVEQARPVAEFVIDLETAHLTPDSTVQERQEVARRVLPILTASEDNLYTQDNLQRLALRLRMKEQDLLLWAREIREEEARRQHARQRYQQERQESASSGEDSPAAGGSEEEPPPDLLPEGVAPAGKVPSGRRALALPMASSSRSIEAFCLGMLLQDPALLFQINRKLRELAAGDPDLLAGPLQALCADDFSQGDYREVMQVFIRAANQHEQEPLDYVREHLDENLSEELDRLLMEDVKQISHKVAHRFTAQVDVIWKEFQRTQPRADELRAKVLQRLLELRQRRLQREHEEIQFLLTETDQVEQDRYLGRIHPSIRALRSIQRELKRTAVMY